MADKVVRLDRDACKELRDWLTEQTSVEIVADYKEIIFRRGSALELRASFVEAQDEDKLLKAVKEPA